MRILSVSPFPVLPLSHGGRVRAYRLAVGLARAGAKVDLACPWHPGLPLRAFKREGITIRPFAFAANILPVLLGDRILSPLLQLSWQPFTLGPRRLLRQSRLYDLVEFHFCAYPSWMSRAARTTRVVYSAHNVEVDYATAKRLKGLHGLSGRQVGLLEGRAVDASDLVVACTDTDARRLVQLYGPTAIAVISNGFDEGEIWSGKGLEREEAREKLGLQAEELAILFVGGRALHNRRAVAFLEHQLLPGLRRPARLIIVGECARPRRDTHVLALGLVDRLSPLLAAADVAVNPIESGSGSNVKLAEYIASGLPVVTTPIGLRGYEAYAHLVTVAELDAFVEAVDATNRRPAPSPELAELSWNALGRRLYQVYADLLSRPHSPS